ncbi:MAG: hypothetical protein OEY23_00155 [Acidimicrobiia bacterium]|nr:hypothetical protein [Acidimicrobiia bacterium]
MDEQTAPGPGQRDPDPMVGQPTGATSPRRVEPGAAPAQPWAGSFDPSAVFAAIETGTGVQPPPSALATPWAPPVPTPAPAAPATGVPAGPRQPGIEVEPGPFAALPAPGAGTVAPPPAVQPAALDDAVRANLEAAGFGLLPAGASSSLDLTGAVAEVRATHGAGPVAPAAPASDPAAGAPALTSAAPPPAMAAAPAAAAPPSAAPVLASPPVAIEHPVAAPAVTIEPSMAAPPVAAPYSVEPENQQPEIAALLARAGEAPAPPAPEPEQSQRDVTALLTSRFSRVADGYAPAEVDAAIAALAARVASAHATAPAEAAAGNGSPEAQSLALLDFTRFAAEQVFVSARQQTVDAQHDTELAGRLRAEAAEAETASATRLAELDAAEARQRQQLAALERECARFTAERDRLDLERRQVVAWLREASQWVQAGPEDPGAAAPHAPPRPGDSPLAQAPVSVEQPATATLPPAR